MPASLSILYTLICPGFCLDAVTYRKSIVLLGPHAVAPNPRPRDTTEAKAIRPDLLNFMCFLHPGPTNAWNRAAARSRAMDRVVYGKTRVNVSRRVLYWVAAPWWSHPTVRGDPVVASTGGPWLRDYVNSGFAIGPLA